MLATEVRKQLQNEGPGWIMQHIQVFTVHPAAPTPGHGTPLSQIGFTECIMEANVYNESYLLHQM